MSLREKIPAALIEEWEKLSEHEKESLEGIPLNAAIITLERRAERKSSGNVALPLGISAVISNTAQENVFLEALSPEEKEHFDQLNEGEKECYLSPIMPVSFAVKIFRDRLSSPQAAAKEVKDQALECISAAETRPQQQDLFAPYPRPMTRLSMFFPMAKLELAKKRERFENLLISHGNSWGTLEYTGPKLDISDEDFLMALLAIIQERNSVIADPVSERLTYAYRGALLPVFQILGINRPSGKDYDKAEEVYDRLTEAKIRLTIQKTSTRGKAKKELAASGPILSYAQRDCKTNEFIIAVNPYFYEIFTDKEFTLVDVKTRAKLPSPLAKALHRHIMSHDGMQKYKESSLSNMINYSEDSPRERRRRLKKALEQLQDKGLITFKIDEGKDERVIYINKVSSSGQTRGPRKLK